VAFDNLLALGEQDGLVVSVEASRMFGVFLCLLAVSADWRWNLVV
jgi:hypothetical protein